MCPYKIISNRSNFRRGVMSVEGNDFSTSKSNGPLEIELQADLVSYGTLAAEIPTALVSSEETK
ncbi:hypothetical protein Bca52824_046125 [Brassica carinata]|uniref:Uncharacterized protein n=1 Tax=Brassica carinata TaxID=52824 RepID=A0A8X7US61_BRACI|nr:hypothetical protein Bca52824_046125 [Brassica carinata]